MKVNTVKNDLYADIT